MKIKILLAVILSAALASCGGPSTTAGKPPKVDEQSITYKIGVGDQLQVQVWRSPELSSNVPVRPDGKISIALVGDVVAAGRSTDELAGAIEKQLSNFVRTPQVTVIVSNAASADFLRRVRVTGAVNNPLSVPYRQGMTVLDMVLEAGGLTPFANGNSAKLYRKTGDSVKVYSVRLKDILNKGRLETNYELAPSDIVTIPERAF